MTIILTTKNGSFKVIQDVNTFEFDEFGKLFIRANYNSFELGDIKEFIKMEVII